MLDQMCASLGYIILGMVGDLHDHQQGRLLEPVLMLFLRDVQVNTGIILKVLKKGI